MGSDIKSLVENFYVNGTWWLPGSETEKSGTLTFDPEDGIKLELSAPLDGSNHIGLKRYDMIHGLTSRAKQVTLLNCVSISGLAVTQSGGAVFPTDIRADMLIHGKWAPIGEQRSKYDKVIVSIHNSHEFFGSTGLRNEWDADYYIARWDKRSPITLDISGGEASIVLRCKPSYKSFGEIKIQEEIVFEISSNKGKIDLEDALNGPVSSMHALLNFAVGHRVPLLTVEGVNIESKIVNEKTMPAPTTVSIFYRQRTSSPSKKSMVGPHLLLFLGKMDEIRKADILTIWDNIYSENTVAIQLFIDSGIHDKAEKLISFSFIQIVSAMETLHRGSGNRLEEFNKKTLRSVKRKVSDCLKDEEKVVRDLVLEKLCYANEVNFRTRMSEIFDVALKYVEINEADSIISRVVKLRNYFTHHPKNKEHLAQDVLDVWKVTQLLWGVFVVYILNKLGLDDAYIQDRINNALYLKNAFYWFVDRQDD